MLSRGTRKWGASVHVGALVLGVILVVALVVAVAGCTGGGDGGTPSASPSLVASVDSRIAAGVPAPIASAGKVIAAIDPRYPPDEFHDTDGKTIIGFDVDLFTAVAAKLGLTVQWQPADFTDIIPGVTAGRYQVGVSSLPVNADREGRVLMVTYLTAGTQWAQPTGGTVDPADPCGRTIAVQTQTVQSDELAVRSQQCVAAGRPAITIDGRAKQEEVTGAVLSGAADAMVADSPVTGYAVRTSNDRLALLGPVTGGVPYGFVLPKAETDFAAAMAKALGALMADGTYATILAKWGLTAGALTAPPEINPSLPPTPPAVLPSLAPSAVRSS